MTKKSRAQQQILKLLHKCGELSVSEVVKMLDSSEATVRRHFAELEEHGDLIRVYGGVRLPVAENMAEYHYMHRAVTHVQEKRLIGEVASRLIQEGDRLFFDSGTTVYECSKMLGTRLERQDVKDVRVVTNSLSYSESLADSCPVVLTGGRIRSKRMDLVGAVALQSIKQYHFSRALLGADGVSSDGLISTTDEDTSELASLVLQQCRDALILVDSSKLGNASFVNYGNLKNDKCTLITDSNIDPVLLSDWRAMGIKIIIAGEETESR